ncbi:hypothetical protein LV779_32460 [Streptomyces thinghirensis]|nr:hypothetical protein [Streptomyces thinghirensis]
MTDLTNENSNAPCEDATIRTALQYSCNNVFARWPSTSARTSCGRWPRSSASTTSRRTPVRA